MTVVVTGEKRTVLCYYHKFESNVYVLNKVILIEA